MIVRIMFDGQFEIGGAVLDELNEIDNALVEAASSGSSERVIALLQRMHDVVYSKGKRLAPEELRESSIILPPSDASLEEVQEIFSGEGLIPG